MRSPRLVKEEYHSIIKCVMDIIGGIQALSVFMKTVGTHFKPKQNLKIIGKQHIRECHKIVAKLSCYLCMFSEPTDINKYCAHPKTHLRNKETVKCPFVDCSFKSSVLSTFTTHRSRYHESSTLNHRPELFVNPTLTNAVLEEELISDTEAPPSYDSVPEAEPDLKNGEAIKRQLASLFLRMQTILQVSNSAVQEVIDELFDIGNFAYTNIKKIIEKVLEENNCPTDASVVASLSDQI